MKVEVCVLCHRKLKVWELPAEILIAGKKMRPPGVCDECRSNPPEMRDDAARTPR